MTDDGTGRDLRSQVAELSRIAAALGAWEDSRRQDNRDYRDDVARFHGEFRRVHDELGAISSAVTNAAIHMEGISQRLTNAVDDIADLKRASVDHDKRISSL